MAILSELHISSLLSKPIKVRVQAFTKNDPCVKKWICWRNYKWALFTMHGDSYLNGLCPLIHGVRVLLKCFPETNNWICIRCICYFRGISGAGISSTVGGAIIENGALKIGRNESKTEYPGHSKTNLPIAWSTVQNFVCGAIKPQTKFNWKKAAFFWFVNV